MKLNMLLQTLKQVTGINKLQTGTIVTENRGVIYFQTDKLQVTNKSLAPLHIDGDPAETSKKFEIEINKDCFRLLRP
jgi:diacylglycerol kinase family enzyme